MRALGLARAARGLGRAVLAALLLWGCAAPVTPARAPDAVGLSGSGGVNLPQHRGRPHVVLVSLDGFHPAYLDRFDLPNMQAAARRGARAGAMIPVFPSLTFPNHFSLVTGLHPERHGLVANSFYDPVRRDTYRYTDPASVTDGTWYRGEPIWVTAERQGMVAACYFWPGSEAAIAPAGSRPGTPGIRPTIWNRYDGSVPNERRVATVLEWLALPEDRRPHMITLYFSALDSASHGGPLHAAGIERTAQQLDRSIGALVKGIEGLPIRDRIYLLLTSDHGMVDTTPAHAVPLDSLMSLEEVVAAFEGPVANVHLKDPSRARAIVDGANARLEHGRAYLRRDLPERLHYRADPRAGDIVIVMDESWTVTNGGRTRSEPPRERWGMHGWDPELPSMHALFVAAGPGIPAGTVLPRVRNVDVYPLLTALLGLAPARGIDGSPDALHRALIPAPR